MENIAWVYIRAGVIGKWFENEELRTVLPWEIYSCWEIEDTPNKILT